jgi:hypothetical protein
MNRRTTSLALFILLLSGAPLFAVQYDSAVIHIGVDDTGGYGVDNIVNYLQGTGRFSTLANIDVDASGVPSAAQLSVYDSVLVTTDNRAGTLTGGGLGTQLGDVLDDYVLGGGRAVLSTFAGNVDIGVDGDILSLSPHTPVGPNASAGTLNMGSAVTSHFVFDGVSSFVSEYASQVSLASGGIVLASYASGTLGVLTVADDSVMFVNAFPADGADHSNGSDFGLVFANALAPPIPEPSSFALIGLAAASTGFLRRRRCARS